MVFNPRKFVASSVRPRSRGKVYNFENDGGKSTGPQCALSLNDEKVKQGIHARRCAVLTSKLLFIVFSSRSIHLYARPDLECTLGAARRCMFSPEICRMCPHRARAQRCLFSKTGTLHKRGVENDDASPSRKEVGLNKHTHTHTH